MGTDHIPIRDAAARRLAERDLHALNATAPPGFRVERTQLRFEVALKNGLSQREAARLEQLAQPPTRTAQWMRQTKRVWTSARLRIAVGALATCTTAMAVWAVVDAQPQTSTEWLAAGTQSVRHELADGSSIVLAPGARGRLDVSGQDVHFELQQGLASFDALQVDEQRQFRISAANYEVTVVGTRFSVRYDAVAGFEAQVREGELLVRVPDQQAPLRIIAGDVLTANHDTVTLRHHDVRSASTESNRTRTPSRSATARSAAPGSASGASAEGTQRASADVSATGARGETEREPVAVDRTAERGSTRSDPATRTARKRTPNPSPAAKVDELALLSRARKALAASQPSQALTWINTHRRRFANGQLTEEREALRVEALRHIGRDDEARRAAGEFKKRFPKSVLAPQMPTDDP